ncbi:MAG: aromatic alcohol reductase [Advenella sp.]|uniref:Aromatic alcohol reductase n=1 Tax=Advenella kashmirensis TaxID=310575 RepID=A0A356LLW8_9BURK|nr:aromatic alcohol reductase [Advenella kashmirensis]
MNDLPENVNMDNILVLGAGELGMAILRYLAPRQKNAGCPLAVLVSPQSMDHPTQGQAQKYGELRAMGARLLPFDLMNSAVEDLIQVFGQFHTVINCTGFVAGPGTQIKLTEAVLAAGVRRYFPWQFGVDYDVIGKGSGQPVFDEQYDVRNILRSQSKTEWVIVSTGMFTSFLFEPTTGLIDFERGIVRGLGSWETKVTVTTPDDIGRLTTEILLEHPRIMNQVVFVASDTVSYSQLATIVEEVTERTFKRDLLTKEKLDTALARHPEDVMARYRVAFALGDGMWWDKAKTYNAQKGIPTTDVKTWLLAHKARVG